MVLLLVGQPRLSNAEECIASVYSTKDKDQNGDKTASGIKLDDRKPTMAHRTYKLRGWMRITNLKTGQTEVLQVTDRGPYIRGRCADITKAAANRLGIDGLARVRVEAEAR